MKCAVEMGSGGMIYVPSSMTIGSGIEATLCFYRNYLRGCNVGTTYGRDLYVCR
jgi:hypothetical protein